MLAFAQVARAGDGFFVTASAGQSRVKTNYVSRYLDSARSSLPQSKLDGRNLYWSVGVGYGLTNLLRVVAGYEDWGKSTASSAAADGTALYPLTVEAKGVYAAYAPVLQLALGLELQAEVGFLYSDLHLGTNFGSINNVSDTNVRASYSLRPRYGLGLAYKIPVLDVKVGIKYLQIDLPDARVSAGSAFSTGNIRPSTVVVSAQYSF